VTGLRSGFGAVGGRLLDLLAVAVGVTALDCERMGDERYEDLGGLSTGAAGRGLWIGVEAIGVR